MVGLLVVFTTDPTAHDIPGDVSVHAFVKPEGERLRMLIRLPLEAMLDGFVEQDLAISADWVEEAVLDANPALVKTMTVQPPRGQGAVRLVRIGAGENQIDLQPCGGTHVARTGEIGRIRIGKIENKGRQNRRVNIQLD